MKLSDHEKIMYSSSEGYGDEVKTGGSIQYILFRLLTKRKFNGDAFQGTIRTLWASAGGLTIRAIEDNLFLGVFNTKDDMERVFVQSPCTFDKQLVQIVHFEGDKQPSAAKFIYSAFWVRVFNPFDYTRLEIDQYNTHSLVHKLLKAKLFPSY